MIKQNKGKLFISSILILLPIFVGNYVLPILTLFLHWFCLFFTSMDSKNKQQNKKVWNMIFWLCPCISLFANGISYLALSHNTIKVEHLTPGFFGLLFVFVGNYLPKCRQNHTIGIKVPWTLYNEENWNYTHRIAGKTWVCSGFFMLCSLFLSDTFKITVFFIVLLLAIIVPVLSSYLYYRKQKANGTYSKNPDGTYSVIMSSVIGGKISLVIAIITIFAVGSLLSTGDIVFQYEEDKLVVDATYWNNLEIDYTTIQSLSYVEHMDAGSREFGFGSLRLLMGTFRNDTLGNYTRYSYTDCDSCVVITISDKTIVLGAKTKEKTLEIYEILKKKSGL